MGKVLPLTAILAFAAFALAVLGRGALRAQGPLPDAAASFREQEARMGAGPGTVVVVAIICLPRLGVLLLPWVALQFSRTFGSVGCAARWISFRAHTHCKKINDMPSNGSLFEGKGHYRQDLQLRYLRLYGPLWITMLGVSITVVTGQLWLDASNNAVYHKHIEGRCAGTSQGCLDGHIDNYSSAQGCSSRAVGGDLPGSPLFTFDP